MKYIVTCSPEEAALFSNPVGVRQERQRKGETVEIVDKAFLNIMYTDESERTLGEILRNPGIARFVTVSEKDYFKFSGTVPDGVTLNVALDAVEIKEDSEFEMPEKQDNVRFVIELPDRPVDAGVNFVWATKLIGRRNDVDVVGGGLNDSIGWINIGRFYEGDPTVDTSGFTADKVTGLGTYDFAMFSEVRVEELPVKAARAPKRSTKRSKPGNSGMIIFDGDDDFDGEEPTKVIREAKPKVISAATKRRNRKSALLNRW